MAARYLKIVFVTLIGVMAMLYGIQNIINLDQAFGLTSYLVGMRDHLQYPASIAIPVESAFVVGMALGGMIMGEIACGLLSLRGAWDLWARRTAPGEDFNSAKKFALLGCGVGVVVWMGFSFVIGGAYFQMWQTEIGSMSMNTAFQIFMACFAVLLFVNMRDE